MNVELDEVWSKFEVWPEYLLGSRPMRVDLLIKKDRDMVIRKNIGKIFRTYNFLEYKTPDDYISVDDFYKVYAYACKYIADTGATGEIAPAEVTITFICNHYPARMLQSVAKDREIYAVKREDGIYDLTGDPFPMQLIIIHELTKEKNYWLQSLRSNITDSEEIRNLAEHYEKYQDEVLYSDIMNAIVNANWDMFEEEKAMCKCEALRRLFEPDIQAAAKAAAEEAAEAATKTATEKRLKQDISICIGRFRKMQIPRNDVVKIIAEDYSMNEKEAQNCVDECWTA
mgnify:FL=1